MKCKFERGEKVLHNGEERTIMVSRKDFGSKSIIYLLDNDEQVAEKDLQPAKRPKRVKKSTPKASPVLQDRLKKLSDYMEQIEAQDDFDQKEFNELIEAMSDKEFAKFEKMMVNKYETE